MRTFGYAGVLKFVAKKAMSGFGGDDVRTQEDAPVTLALFGAFRDIDC